MGNAATHSSATHSAYIAEIKGNGSKKTYWLCPDHMPIRMHTVGKLTSPPNGTKVYRFELPMDVPTGGSSPIPSRTIKRYKQEASKVENVTSQLTARDVEILAHMVAGPTTDSSVSSDESSLTRMEFAPIVKNTSI